MRRYLTFFGEICEKEQDRFCLWWGVFFAVGIICNLKYGFDIHPALLFGAVSLTIYRLAQCYRRGNIDITCHLMLIALFFICGVKLAKYRNSSVGGVSLEITEGVFKVKGVVSDIRRASHGLQITLTDVKLGRGRARLKPYPAKIRFNLPKKYSGQINLGDNIKCRAKLARPKGAILPGGYDFSFRAKFAGIGMSGYALSPPKVISKGSVGFDKYFASLREKMIDRIAKVLSPEESAVAASILLGESGGLRESTLENMRSSGISHIMCVSGLHLSLVCLIVFYLARLIMNLFPIFSQSRDVKIIAIFIALPAGLFYLGLSGMKVAALRAFIMVAIIFIAIAAARFTHPMRSVMIAAIGILSFHPEYIFFASFQLSFVAVIALIGGYEIYMQYKTQSSAEPSVAAAIWRYIMFNMQASFLAGVLTAPVVISHFYRFASYSIPANLLAVPITSFVIMPFGLIGGALMPFGLDYLPLKMMSLGVEQIIKIANFVASLSFSTLNIGYITTASLSFYMAGFFWLFIFSSRVRFFGIGIMLIGGVLMFCGPAPSFIINFQNRQVGFYNKDRAFEIHAGKISKFTARYWAHYSGAAKPVIKKDEEKVFIDKDGSAAIIEDEGIKLCPQLNMQDRTCKYSFHQLRAPRETIIIFCHGSTCRVR